MTGGIARAAGLRRKFLYPLVIFAVNLLVCWRYFRSGYITQLPSIEGVFMALEQYIRRYWPTYDWFAMWYGGMPFARVYQPGLHYAVAAWSALTGISVPFAYHELTSLTYSLGGVGLYFLIKALTGQPATSLCGALLFSLFSPSTLLVPAIRYDVGGVFNPRRLQALTVYGEGPNQTGLMLAMFALAAIHVAYRRRNALSTCIAGFAAACVPMVSWPATVALVLAIACYALAMDRVRAGRLAAIGLLAFGFASPFAPPSTIFGTFAQANAMDDAPTPGAGRWIAFALLIAAVAAARWALARFRAPFALRFPALWALVTGWFVIAATAFGVRMIPYPVRFHIAMEIPIAMTAAISTALAVKRRPEAGKIAVTLCLLFCASQIRPYMRYSRLAFQRLDITKTPEYALAGWADANLHGQRIFMRGTFAFWFNDFTETPQVSGFFDQSLSNREDRDASYVIAAGHENNEQSADYSLLWLKAFAAAAVHMEGPHSADFYKDFRFADRYKGVLPLVWSQGDDYVYRVPERTEGLARVVPNRDVVRHSPATGVDAGELRLFVGALDDPSLPRAAFQWRGMNDAAISAPLSPDQAIAVAINYDPGWTATMRGRPVPLHPDGLGLIAIEPNCSGACDIQMHWSPRREPAFAIGMFALALGISIVWTAFTRNKGNPDTGSPEELPA